MRRGRGPTSSFTITMGRLPGAASTSTPMLSGRYRRQFASVPFGSATSARRKTGSIPGAGEGAPHDVGQVPFDLRPVHQPCFAFDKVEVRETGVLHGRRGQGIDPNQRPAAVCHGLILAETGV